MSEGVSAAAAGKKSGTDSVARAQKATLAMVCLRTVTPLDIFIELLLAACDARRIPAAVAAFVPYPYYAQ
jgi:hypothetical protein